MKQLISKELREMRFLPLVCAAVLAVFLMLWGTITHGHTEHPEGQIDTLTAENNFGFLAIACVFAGWLPGSCAIAHERQKRTLQFLTLLPLGRANIWVAKLSAGAVITVVSIIALVTVHFLTLALLFGFHDARNAYLANIYYSPHLIIDIVSIFFGSIATYGLSLLLSTLLDRFAVVAIISLVIEITVLPFVWVAEQFLRMTSLHAFLSGDWIMQSRDYPIASLFTLVVLLAVTAICYYTSWILFMPSETLSLKSKSSAVKVGWSMTGLSMLTVWILWQSELALNLHYLPYRLFNVHIK